MEEQPNSLVDQEKLNLYDNLGSRTTEGELEDLAQECIMYMPMIHSPSTVLSAIF